TAVAGPARPAETAGPSGAGLRPVVAERRAGPGQRRGVDHEHPAIRSPALPAGAAGAAAAGTAAGEVVADKRVDDRHRLGLGRVDPASRPSTGDARPRRARAAGCAVVDHLA